MALPYAILTPLFRDGMQYRSQPYNLPPHWNAVSGEFSTSSEIYMSVSEEGELLYNDTPLNQLRINDADNANYRISFDVLGLSGFDIEIRGRRSSDDTFVGLRANSSFNTLTLFESDGGTIINTTTTAHTLNSNEYYRLALWCFNDTYYGILNGANLINLTASGSLTSDADSFSLYVRENADNTFATIYWAQINELIPAVSPVLDDSNLYVLLRELVQTELQTIISGDFADFKRVYNIYKSNKDVGYTNAGWWEFGYPLREPPTENTF